jgi:hypothetical protein
MKFQATVAAFLLGLMSFSYAQDYDDLTILYADGNYEKLVAKAEKYTQKDDTKKDPIPYIWMAKGLYKISISGNDDPAYKNAFKDAMGSFAKAVKYDPENEARSKHSEFVEEFTNAAAELIINDADAEDYGKAYGWSVKYGKMAKNEAGNMFMQAALKYRRSDKSGANNAWKEAKEMMEGVNSLSSWLEADRKLLRAGLMESASCLIDSRQNEKARALLDEYAALFAGDEDWQSRYDALMN